MPKACFASCGGAALAVLISSAGCASHASEAAAKPTPAAVTPTVVASNGRLQPTVALAGVIAPYRQSGVSSAISEPIISVDVREGDFVHAGQVLARLETNDLRSQLLSSRRVVAENRAHVAQLAHNADAVTTQYAMSIRAGRAALAQAVVNLAAARHDYERYATLARNGYLPQQTIDQQRTTVVSDEQAVSAAQASLISLQSTANANGNGHTAGSQRDELAAAQAAVDAAAASTLQLEQQISRAIITAPTDGFIEAVNANPGEYPSGRQMFTIEDSRSVYALFSASSAQVTKITRGASAVVTTTGSSAKRTGTVDAVLDQLQPGTTNFTVKVLVANTSGELHAGLPARGIVNLPPVRGVEIPSSAFVDDDHNGVYVVRDDTVHLTSVVERSSAGTSAIVDGISAGTRVVKSPQSSGISDGDRVRI